MPAPTVQAVGAVASGAASITPAFPSPIAANDIIIGVGESVGGSNYPTIATNGFAHIDSVSPVVQDTNTQLSVVWARYDGVMTAHAWGDSGDHNLGRYIAIRGCPTTGNPWDVVAVAVEATSDTSASWPTTAPTTGPDRLVLLILATSADIGTAQISSVTNAALTSITEQMDNAITTGNGGVIICYSGIKATAAAVGVSTATLTTAGFKAFMTLALKEGPPAAGPPILVMAPPRPS
jgi:hypothetical protein